MMSSEEDTDCYGLYGDKLLKKSKRTRQRVDAGEPRNSYSSIPNFSSRPSFMSGGLYGAIFSQSQQHFGLFGPNYGPAKMLNELLGRQVKQAQDASGPDLLSTMDVVNADGVANHGFEGAQLNSPAGGTGSASGGAVIRRGSLGGSGSSVELDGGSTPPQPSDLAHHMLRNILQNKKEQLMALDQELRAAQNHQAGGGSGERSSPDNNNSINKNNNNNSINSDAKGDSVGGNCGSGDMSDSSECGGKVIKRNDSISLGDSSSADETSQAGQDVRSQQNHMNQKGGQKKDSLRTRDELLDDEMGLNSRSDSDSMPSPDPDDSLLLRPKEELEMDNDKDGGMSPSPQGKGEPPVALDMKRARVENIVSTMRSSPALPPQQPQVNGCKKRKLYHPQQHDNSAVERYAASAAAVYLGLGSMSEDDDDGIESPQIHQKRVEKNALKSQLRSMQEQLAEMQQKYVQLCTRMNQDSESQEADDNSSDLEQEDVIEQPSEKVQRMPMSSPLKELPSPKTSTPNMLSQVMSKMLPGKLHSQLPLHPHLPPSFNGAHPLLQHMQHGAASSAVHELAALQHPQHSHHAISNAAAMYLGVSQKLFLEQEARMAKEVAEHNERERERLQQQQQQQQASTMPVQQHQPQHQSQPPSQPQPQPTLPMPAQHPPQPPPQQTHHSPGQPQQQPMQMPPKVAALPSDLSDRLSMMRTASAVGPMSGSDLEGLADMLKSEITASLSNLVDSIVSRFIHQRRFLGKQSEAAAAAAEQLSKDLIMASQLLDRKSPRTKVADRQGVVQQAGNGQQVVSSLSQQTPSSHAPAAMMTQGGPRMNGSAFPPMGMPMHVNGPQQQHDSSLAMNMNMPPHVRPSPTAAMFQAPKPPQQQPQSQAQGQQQMNPVTAAALYNSMKLNDFCMPDPREQNPEQTEALPLVVTPKKKRSKVTDTRITPRTVSRILAQDGIGPPQAQMESPSNGPGKPYTNPPVSVATSTPSGSPSPRPSYHPPPPSMMPMSLPTSVAIPNPSLHESQVFSPYSPFFNPHAPHGPHAPQPQPAQLHHMKMSSSPPGLGGMMDTRDSPPLPHPPTMLHPALLAAAHHGSSPDYGHIRAAMDTNDRNSDCNSGDPMYEPTSSTLTPMHLRKAKLMFFWVRYPSSAVLKMYFPDIKFNKNNTAQLVKWFSNFREFYYIQMEKYARQAVSEGVKSADDLHVSGDSEIYRVLNLHYNRNNHIEVPSNFRYVVEQTLREFFKAIQGGKDTEQSWKKSIYKIISRLDDPVPEYFKTPNFLEQLE
ncbi:homeobox protein prospero isoform X2 [Phlebotomus argentipes]|uniref:homeobox protein prospero isoform X2 n=1 Tax=Phlebotomus argentipes TaxID=94469 RepID=UPI002893174E|nr:homeobox protein prospero isoform X2 [Phlebotomus argentipes]